MPSFPCSKYGSYLICGALLGLITLTGCSKNKDLDKISRQQAETIESLNKEIARLNEELDQAIQAQDDLAKAKAELEKQLRKELEAGDMSLNLGARGLVLTMQDRILFDSGKAELKETAKKSLEKVATVLGEKVGDHYVSIEGHTDNVPIRYSGWRSNWELSTARSTEVIHHFLEGGGIAPERLAAVGYAEFHPVSANDTTEGRQLNRRVEVVISPRKMENGSKA
ncbi:MAG: OmpA family protein [Candidatus Omnitrophota bacterium]